MKQKNGKTRKNYEKPLLRAVNISSGVQTLGIGCKLEASGIVGMGNNPCIPIGSPCSSSQGS